MSQWEQLALVAIIAELGNKHELDRSKLVKLFFIWQLFALKIFASRYLAGLNNRLQDRLRNSIQVEALWIYLTSRPRKKEFREFNDSIDKIEKGIGRVTGVLGLAIGQTFNLWIFTKRVGWLFPIPIVLTVLKMCMIYAVNNRYTKYERIHKLDSPPKFYQSHSNVASYLRAIKFYAWDRLFKENVKCDYHTRFTMPIFWKVAKNFIDVLGCASSQIISTLTLLLYLNRSSGEFSYADLVLLLNSVNSLSSFTMSLVIGFDQFVRMREGVEFIQGLATPVPKKFIDRCSSCSNSEFAVELEDCRFSWGEGMFALLPISLQIDAGDFVTVVGRIGCGKSSLIRGMCGEMPIVSGNGRINGRVGYVSQKPWIMNATFRENILMGADYDKTLFQLVIKASALVEDVQQFPAGDLTEIGANGINLSGGQKVRLALASGDSDPAEDSILDSVNTKKAAFTIHPELERPVFRLAHFWWFIKQSGYVTVAAVIAIETANALSMHYFESWKLELMSDGNIKTRLSSLRRFLLMNALVEIARFQVRQIEVWIREKYWTERVTKRIQRQFTNSLISMPLPLAERLSTSTIMRIYEDDIEAIADELPRILYDHILFESSMLISIFVRLLYISPKIFILCSLFAIVLALQRQDRSRLAETMRRLNSSITKITPFELKQTIFTNRAYMRIHEVSAIYLEKLFSVLVATTSHEDTYFVVTMALSLKKDIINKVLESTLLTINIWNCLSSGSAAMAVYLNTVGSLLIDIRNCTQNLENALEMLSRNSEKLSRLYIYIEALPHEESSPWHDDPSQSKWLTDGAITFSNYSMRYRPELDIVLKDLCFSIKKSEKVGIVGRTGAGKSSITYALMRMVEADCGSIVIDGVDISGVSLYDLRSQIAIIPQDPVLFEGTIRDNLDPEQKFSDEEVWAALESVHMDDLLSTPSGVYVDNPKDKYSTTGPWIEGVGLEKWVLSGGINFSVGQRQLISLCRALLWQRKIVILDEATANVDSNTDRIMQAVIRNKFSDCTVLTIAHRLNTIMDSDRILVMDKGQIAEFDSPKNLLENKSSHFSQLVESMNASNGK
ncbi:Canalicular multispecific organic anion transporter 1 [Coemansia interrupta]|uniref:Canalicular multispecific organic anion transporter 1 n=1 Tax=Coemansia interrupta TaxID=1126814 RepID=A0A9W8LNQ4_9FUNG|nr:Canalicular multispecific organic anion transporter 1 [Coemansia interrupta]